MITIGNLQFETFIPEAEVKQTVKKIAAKINRDYEGKCPVLVAILNGSFIFAADLVRELTIDHEIHFAKVASYSGTESTGVVKKLLGVDIPLTGRDVIIVEDIVDTGITMSHLLDSFMAQAVKSVEVCSLIVKPDRLKVKLDLKYCGMEIPDAFILGYGLDYNNKGRQYKDIYKVIDH